MQNFNYDVLAIDFLGFILFGVCSAFRRCTFVCFASFGEFLSLSTLSLSTLSVLFSFILSFWDSDTNVVLLESHRLLKICSYVYVLLSQLLRLVKFCSFLKFTDSLLGRLPYNIEPIQRVIFLIFLFLSMYFSVL